jgi:hypothetical protein
LICLSLDVPWATSEELANSPALEDIELSMRIPHEDFKLYETIEESRFNAKEPLPVLEFDVQTAAPLRRRLDDTGEIFSLVNAYDVILKDGGFLTIDKTRAPKTNSSKKGRGGTAASVAASEQDEAVVSATKGNMLSIYFGPNGPSFDVLIRALHPILLTKNDWLTVNDYSLSLSTYLASKNIKICMAFELWIYFRLHIKKNYFAGHNSICNAVASHASIRGSLKDLNLYQVYTTMTIYAIKVRRYYETFQYPFTLHLQYQYDQTFLVLSSMLYHTTTFLLLIMLAAIEITTYLL